MNNHILSSSCQKKIITFFFYFILTLLSFRNPAHARPDAEIAPAGHEKIELIMPQPGATVMSKKPMIKFTLPRLAPADSLLVIIDGMDVSNILREKDGVYILNPVEALAAGPHQLQIIITPSEGDEQTQEFHFRTRHTKLLEEAYSKNELAADYRHRVLDTAESPYGPEWQVNSSLSSVSGIKEKYFDSALSFNLRDIRQDEPIEDPEKAFNLADYLFDANFSYKDLQIHTQIGDVNINESTRTIQGLARRGGVFGVDLKEYSLNSFFVKSKDVFGFTGGAGIGGSLDDSIVGVSTGGRLFSDRFNIKAIYATGGEQSESYNEYEENPERKGDIYGLVLGADLFQNILHVEGEYAYSELDGDTEDEFSAEKDKAYGASANVSYENYTLGGAYEYYGPYFEVIGNPYGTRDLEIITAQSGAYFDISTIDLNFSQNKDNVEEDELYAQYTTVCYAIDYRFTKFENFQIGAHFDKSVIKSDNEQEFDNPVKTVTDTYSGDICYSVWKLNLTFNGGYSYQDDKVGSLSYDTYENIDFDTATQTYALSLDASFDHIRFSPCFSFNTVEDKAAEVDTDTYTVTFNIEGNIYWQELRYNTSGTFNRSVSSDELQDFRTFNADFSLSYCSPQRLWLFENTTVGVEGGYDWAYDKVQDEKDDEWTVFMKLSTCLPVLF